MGIFAGLQPKLLALEVACSVPEKYLRGPRSFILNLLLTVANVLMELSMQ